MKHTFRILACVMAGFISITANAQVYPISNPSYIPTAVAAPATYSAPADYSFSISGISTATIRVTGTCTGLTAAPQVTNDGTNWTTVQAIPVAGGGNITSITAPGFWRINTAGATRSRLHITVLSASCTVAMAGTEAQGAVYLLNPQTVTGPVSVQDSTATYYLSTMDDKTRPGFQKLTDGTSVVGVTAASTAPVAATPALVVTQSPNGDPCQLSTVTKSFAAVNQGSSATTKLVDISGTKNIYVCAFVASAVGTNPTLTFKSGTHVSADCDTGAATLSGAIIPSATDAMISIHSGSATVFSSGVSNQLCLTTGATTSVQGIITYVQQ